MKTNESTSQLQKGLIGFTKLFPAYQQAPPAIEPGEKSLDDPSPRSFAASKLLASSCGKLIPLVVLRIEADVWLIASLIELTVDGVMIVGQHPGTDFVGGPRLVQAARFQRIQCREKQLAIMAISPINTQSQRHPRRSHRMLRLVPCLPRSVGVGPTAALAKGALTVELSTLCQSQAIPTSSSYCCNPACHKRWKNP